MNPDSSTAKAAPLNILVVDDEANVRRVLSVALETDGHRVVGVLDGVVEREGLTARVAALEEEGLCLLRARDGHDGTPGSQGLAALGAVGLLARRRRKA